MKFQKSILTAMLLLLSFIASAQNLKKVETYYDPFTRTRIHEAYTTLTTPPYARNGVYKEWDQSGVLMTEANFQNGKKHGPYKVFFNAGMRDLVGKGNIGKLYTVSNYTNDKLNGLEQMYNYTFNKPQVILQKTWVNGEQIKNETWYENGKPESVSVLNGMNIIWYPNGTKANEMTMKNGLEEGRVSEWYENGQLAYTGAVKNKCKVGEATAYFKNGVVASKMSFDPTTCKDMHTIQYFSTGKIKWERVGANGHYKAEHYDSLKGFKALSEEWIDDPNNFNGPLLRNGKTIKYFESGKTWLEETYVNGKEEGDYKVFTPTGDVLSGGQYSRGNKVGKWKVSFTQNWDETDLKDSIAYYRIIDFTTKPWPVEDYFVTGEKQFQGAMSKLSPEQFAGKCTWYFKNGKAERELEMNQYGELRSDKQYYESGKLRFEMAPTGFSEGMYSTYNGKEYYESGKVKSEGIVKNNKKTGVWKYYDENGSVTEVSEGY